MYFACRRDMSYGFQDKKILVPYSETEERAQIIDLSTLQSSMPKKTKKGKKSKKVKTVRGFKGVKIVNGKLSLKVSGYSGVQKLAPAQLIRYIPLTRLKSAAKKVLHLSGHPQIKKKKKKSKKKIKV